MNNATVERIEIKLRGDNVYDGKRLYRKRG